jgi:hypothetical protein
MWLLNGWRVGWRVSINWNGCCSGSGLIVLQEFRMEGQPARGSSRRAIRTATIPKSGLFISVVVVVVRDFSKGVVQFPRPWSARAYVAHREVITGRQRRVFSGSCSASTTTSPEVRGSANRKDDYDTSSPEEPFPT